MNNNFLVLIDDISMVPQDKNERLCTDWRRNLDSIFAQNERHEYLEKLIKIYRGKPPVIIRSSPTLVPLIDTLTVPDILFATASAALNKSSYPLLDSFCTALRSIKIDSMVVSGHTDNVGTLNYNRGLSAGRADAVSDYIKQKIHIANSQLLVRWFAYLQPAASNNTEEGRQKNRRVEILVYRHE